MILQTVQDAIIVTDPAGLVTYGNAAAEGLLGHERSLLGKTLDGIDGLVGRLSVSPEDVGPSIDEERDLVRRDGTPVSVRLRTQRLIDEDGRATGTLTIMTDITERKAREHDLQRLSMAVEQSADAIVITDTSARIQYVNPAFEASTGYSRDEVIGQNPRLLKSGIQTDEFYTAMWATLSSGRPWVADLVNRRKDGSFFQEEAVITPVRETDGTITGYLAVKRNVTRERILEAQAIRSVKERALVADTLVAMRPQSSPDDAAQMICEQVVTLGGVSGATILRFDTDGRCHAMGGALASGEPFVRRVLPAARSRYLRDRAQGGPWIEPWVNRPWHPYNQLLTKLGAASLAFAPVEHAGEVFALISIAASEGTMADQAETLPALTEFAGLTGALLGPRVVASQEARLARAQIERVIRHREFRPVFQPIMDLATGRALGYEALTRFSSGMAPDEQFAAAEAVGLGIELEIATLRAAFDAASSCLGPKDLLNVNVSPELVMERSALRSLVRRLPRRVVLEVTEHTAIGDYDAFHKAVQSIGPALRLAVDDAGAGFASFRHILELRPAFVKLDRSLVVDIDVDPAKQALVAGMCQFARSTHCRLIAEGVETEAERATLQTLGIRLAQGFLLGRPRTLAHRAIGARSFEVVAPAPSDAPAGTRDDSHAPTV